MVSLVFALVSASPGVFAEDRRETEQALASIESEIKALQKSLERARTELKDETSALKSFDLQLQSKSRELAILQTQMAEQESEIQRLVNQQANYLETLASRRTALAQQILAAWRISRESRLKLVMNQDNPNQISRLLSYYDHLSAAQSEAISELQTTLSTLDRMRQELEQELEQLAELKYAQSEALSELDQQRTERMALIASMNDSIQGDAQRMATLEQDRRDLETLLERLDNALADIPADLGERLHPRDRRGQLPMPVQGKVLQGFGQARGAGLKWQGWLIGASTGATVRAIAYGRVAYADWLRGYGLLLIVDHGEGFMSLYGHNESLTVDVGDWVEQSERVATAGAPADRQSGVYFELRSAGNAVDPATWIQR